MNLFQSLEAQIGVTDEVSTCYCCDRKNLARTVVFKTTSEWQAQGGDEFVFFGTTCAQNAIAKSGKRFRPSKSKVDALGRTEAEAQLEAERAEVRMYHTRRLVKAGRTLEQAWNWVRDYEDQPNGFYWLERLMKLETT